MGAIVLNDSQLSLFEFFQESPELRVLGQIRKDDVSPRPVKRGLHLHSSSSPRRSVPKLAEELGRLESPAFQYGFPFSGRWK